MPDPELELEVAAIESDAEAEAMVVGPDRASLAAFGTEPLDPAVREPAARAGRAQGSSIAGEVGRFWDGAVRRPTAPLSP